MLLTHHNDTLSLNTYLVNANLRMAKLPYAVFLLIYFFLFSLVLRTRLLWLFPFRLHFWISLNNCKMRSKQRTLFEFGVFFLRKRRNVKARIPSLLVRNYVCQMLLLLTKWHRHWRFTASGWIIGSDRRPETKQGKLLGSDRAYVTSDIEIGI